MSMPTLTAPFIQHSHDILWVDFSFVLCNGKYAQRNLSTFYRVLQSSMGTHLSFDSGVKALIKCGHKALGQGAGHVL